MDIPRREFLRLLGLAAGTAGIGGCDRIWSVPDRLVQLALRGPGLESEAQTVCGLCEGACGLTVRLVDGLPVGLKGNPQHPLSRGGLCPVGKAGLDVLYAPGRIRGPLRRDEQGRHVPTTWEEALGVLSERISLLRASGEAHKVAFLNGEPGLLLDELFRFFMGALGSPNYAKPLDPSSLAYHLTQGLDEAPGFDLAEADCVLSFGQALFEEGPAPIHAISATIGSRADGERAELIHIGSRLSPSACKAGFRVQVNPGTHGAFALGVAQVLVREGRYDEEFVSEHTYGFEDGFGEGGESRIGFRRHLVERYYPDRVSQLCGCAPSQIIEVARRFAEAESPLALVGGEAVQESNATWNVMAVHALNALSGNFNRPGGVVAPSRIPLSPMPSLPSETSRREGSPPDRGGEGGIGPSDPLRALVSGIKDGSRPIEILLMAGWDPVFANPGGQDLRDALGQIPTVVALTPFLDETALLADLVLPTSLFLESWQCATSPVSVPYGTLGLGRPVVAPLFDTRHPGEVVLELGRRLNPDSPGFSTWSGYESFLQHRLEGIALAGQGSVFKGKLEEAWVEYLEERGWRFTDQPDFESFWNDLVRHGGWWNPTLPVVAWPELFPTPSGRFEFWSLALERALRVAGERDAGGGQEAEGALARGMGAFGIRAEQDEACFPHHEDPLTEGEGELKLMIFRPITSRGRFGVASAMVLEMFGHTHGSGWETWAEMDTGTAEEMGLGDGDIVELETDAGGATVVLRVQPGGGHRILHVPLGLGQSGPVGPSKVAGANPLALLPPIRDPLSGAYALNGALGRVRLVRRRPHGEPAPYHEGSGP